MTQHNEKSPAPVAAGNEGNESFADCSTATAYLVYGPNSTGDTYGTWSGTEIPREGHIQIIVPMEVAQRMYADGPQLVGINPECVKAQSRAVRKRRQEQAAKELQERKRHIQQELEDVFADELAELDDRYAELYARIDKQAQDRLDAGEVAR